MNNNDWISVNDSLPEKAGVYTVLTADGKEYEEVYIDLFGTGKKIFLRQNVTYWKEKNNVKCKDCEYLMFSDMYGECSKAYKGIVSPNDSCGKGKLKGGEGK